MWILYSENKTKAIISTGHWQLQKDLQYQWYPTAPLCSISRSRELIICFYLVHVRLHLGYCGQFGATERLVSQLNESSLVIVQDDDGARAHDGCMW